MPKPFEEIEVHRLRDRDVFRLVGRPRLYSLHISKRRPRGGKPYFQYWALPYFAQPGLAFELFPDAKVEFINGWPVDEAIITQLPRERDKGKE